MKKVTSWNRIFILAPINCTARASWGVRVLCPGSETVSLRGGATDREKPAVGKFHQYLYMEAVVAVVEKAAGIECPLQSTGTSRQIVMNALYQYAGFNNREKGDLLGVDYSTVSQGRKRLRDKAEKDMKIKAILESIAKECQE